MQNANKFAIVKDKCFIFNMKTFQFRFISFEVTNLGVNPLDAEIIRMKHCLVEKGCIITNSH